MAILIIVRMKNYYFDERMLRDFYTGLYSDVKMFIMSLHQKKMDLGYQLYFWRKMIDGRLKIPFNLESTGTKKLLEFSLPSIIMCGWQNSFPIDEIDSGIHDLLMKKVVEALEESINGQCIVTTHNTLLLELLPQKYIYIISSNIDGQKVNKLYI